MLKNVYKNYIKIEKQKKMKAENEAIEKRQVKVKDRQKKATEEKERNKKKSNKKL